MNRVLTLARKRRKMTLQQVSTACGVSKTYLWELENGRRSMLNCTVGILSRLAVGYALDVDFLVAVALSKRSS